MKGTCDEARASALGLGRPPANNLTDAQIRAVASNGGVIGIGLWDTAVCGSTAADTVCAMRYVVDLVGDSHVGLGSDFDGYTRAHFDASGMPVLTQAMLDAGLEPASIRRILGGNVLRVLRTTLPSPRPDGRRQPLDISAHRSSFHGPEVAWPAHRELRASPDLARGFATEQVPGAEQLPAHRAARPPW